jgi:hypothetical protein
MRTKSLVVTCLLLIVTAPVAFGVQMHVDCGSPFVFSDSDVNVVVLPYAYAGNSQGLSETGRRISLLIQEDTVLHILGYGRIAAVQFEPRTGGDDQCEPRVVLRKLLGQQSNEFAQIGSGKGLVLVWGLLYEEEGEVYLKSYATSVRRNASDAVDLQFGKFTFTVSPSARVVAFPPRKMSRKALEDVERAYSTADKVYAEPRLTSESRQIPQANCATCPPGQTQGYYIDRSQGNWLHVQVFHSTGQADAGWIPAESTISGQSLDTLMPELHFIRGAVGYLQTRMYSDPEILKRKRDLATADFHRYLKSDSKQEAGAASAVALQLSGIMQVLSDGTPPSWETAIKDFESARALVPGNPEARNVIAVGHIYQDWLSGRWLDLSRRRAQELIDATLLKPNDSVPVKNLTNYYQLLLPKATSATGQPLPDALSAEDVQKRLAMISAFNDRTASPSVTK